MADLLWQYGGFSMAIWPIKYGGLDILPLSDSSRSEFGALRVVFCWISENLRLVTGEWWRWITNIWLYKKVLYIKFLLLYCKTFFLKDLRIFQINRKKNNKRWIKKNKNNIHQLVHVDLYKIENLATLHCRRGGGGVNSPAVSPSAERSYRVHVQ